MKTYYFLCFCFLFIQITEAQVGIGTTTPSNASMLEVKSTTDNGITYRGFMPPRLPLIADLTKINTSISDAGLLVFVLENGCNYIWNGVSWELSNCIGIVTGSEVQFSSATQLQTENVAAVGFSFTITNPSPINPIQLLISADTYTRLDQTTAQTIVIPAGVTTYHATNVFSITNDMIAGLHEVVQLTTTVISGGLGTTAMGIQDTNMVTIIDDDISLMLPFQESFETDGNGTRYITSIPEELNGNRYLYRGMESDYANVTLHGVMDGVYLFSGQNLDDLQSGTASSGQTIRIPNIDISGETNLLFEILIAEDDQASNQDWDTTDFMHIDYSIDGGTYQSLLWVEAQNGSNTEPSLDEDFDGVGDNVIFITDTWTNFSENISIVSGSRLDIRITMNFNAIDEDIAIDNIRITGN